MNMDEIERVIAIAKEVAPKIEGALKEVKDQEIRRVIAKAIVSRILQNTPFVLPRQQSLRPEGKQPSPVLSGEGKEIGGTQGRVLELKAEGFFSEPRNVEQVQAQLRLKGFYHNESDVRMSLLRLAKKNLLRRIQDHNTGRTIFLYVDS
jgi:hypothetical protein